ncbi:hypothetical protein Nepgr_005853 [Nepenthes gracilis]|uniref:Uncharacterized protein n=1 Tax=Nepenthes gracilis TaxID=150966 RepID=A0AAD3S4B1_NEPGR|nr:hypothetical protein Nepgr_005853 [Nepenthes gracilis]
MGLKKSLLHLQNVSVDGKVALEGRLFDALNASIHIIQSMKVDQDGIVESGACTTPLPEDDQSYELYLGRYLKENQMLVCL